MSCWKERRTANEVLPEEVCATNELLEGAESQPGQVASYLLSKHEEKVDHVLGFSFEFLPQLRILHKKNK
jgi:hypothetical protein